MKKTECLILSAPLFFWGCVNTLCPPESVVAHAPEYEGLAQTILQSDSLWQSGAPIKGLRSEQGLRFHILKEQYQHTTEKHPIVKRLIDLNIANFELVGNGTIKFELDRRWIGFTGKIETDYVLYEMYPTAVSEPIDGDKSWGYNCVYALNDNMKFIATWEND